MSAHRAPSGLGAAGKAVWRAVLDDLTAAGNGSETWELDGRELLILEAAARQADLNRELEQALARDGVMIEGSQGQARMNAAATEVRQGRVAVEKLLSALALPSEDGRAVTAAQKRAATAAVARWGPTRRRRGAA